MSPTTTPIPTIGTAAGLADEPQERLRIAAILNPVSCPSGAESMKADLEKALARHELEAEYFETCETETALPIAKRAVETGATLILAVGGDGTVMESINAVIGTAASVGIIPAGTGNLLAANLNIPVNVEAAVDIAVTGSVLSLDLVSVDGGSKYFAIMGGLGYDAQIMRETPREIKQRVGKLAYFLTAIKQLRARRFSVRLTLDDETTVSARAKSVLIANMGQVVKGVRLFPDADHTDGLIHVGILKGVGPIAMARTVWHTMLGKPSASPYFDQYTVKKVIVRCGRSVPFELDGEDVGDATAFIAEVAPQAAKVRVPKP